MPKPGVKHCEREQQGSKGEEHLQHRRAAAEGSAPGAREPRDTREGDRSGSRSLPIPVEGSPPLPVPAGERAVEPTDALSLYLSELRRYPPISRDEEQDLAVRWVEEKDRDAARRLVLSNLRLVVKIAMEYRRIWTNVLDLIGEGNLGLMEAVRRFDPYRGVKLSSYAVYWIRAYILKYLLDNKSLVRMGTTRAQRKIWYRLNREKRELERMGLEVEPKLIAERLEVPERDVREMDLRLARGDLSMDAPVHDEAGSASVGDFMAAGGESAESLVADSELGRIVRTHAEAFAKTLDERDRRILDERILAEEPKTLQAIASEYGLTRERVRQLEARIVSRFKEYLRSQMVDFEYYAGEESGAAS